MPVDTVYSVTTLKDDVVKVLPGSTVSADGEIISGSSSLDEAMVTGESMPVDKTVGSTVIGGTINVGASPIFVKVSKVGNDTMLAQIVKLVWCSFLNRILHPRMPLVPTSAGLKLACV